MANQAYPGKIETDAHTHVELARAWLAGATDADDIQVRLDSARRAIWQLLEAVESLLARSS
jgi:hypothetical protein